MRNYPQRGDLIQVCEDAGLWIQAHPGWTVPRKLSGSGTTVVLGTVEDWDDRSDRPGVWVRWGTDKAIVGPSGWSPVEGPPVASVVLQKEN